MSHQPTLQLWELPVCPNCGNEVKRHTDSFHVPTECAWMPFGPLCLGQWQSADVAMLWIGFLGLGYVCRGGERVWSLNDPRTTQHFIDKARAEWANSGRVDELDGHLRVWARWVGALDFLTGDEVLQ